MTEQQGTDLGVLGVPQDAMRRRREPFQRTGDPRQELGIQEFGIGVTRLAAT